MTSEPTFGDVLHGVLDAQGPALTHADPSETVRPELGGSSGGDGVRPPSDAAVVRPGLGPFARTLGVGGMGVVREAEQRTLARTVAVKSLRADPPSPAAVRHLLQEAYVAGLLDHPNVLPVHDIHLDAQGRPHILMKRVEGEPWSAWARKPARIQQAFDARDALSWNLGVFLQVCNAVAYAHDRGILHRDLKLDNVMIGPFGEVLVLDWGIAVALDERHGDRVPLARDQRRVAGTPRMMPPEMALGDGPSMGVHTDVYLLGGVLYQVLTGRTPHRGDSVQEVLEGIPTSVPELPERVPGELARIVRRAMAFDPADRFADVPALRRAVQRFLDHRGSVRLAARARQAVERLTTGIDQGAGQPVLYEAFDQARFGFEQALTEWPDNPVAHAGLREARLALAFWEVERGKAGVAETLIEPLSDVPAQLHAAIDAAHQARRQAERELHKLKVDADPTVGQRTRVFVVGILGLVWVLAPMGYALARPLLTWWHLYGVSLLLAGLIAGLGFWARDSLSRTALNRISVLTAAMIPVSQMVLDSVLRVLGLSPQDALLARPVLWFTIVAMYAISAVPRLWPVVIVYGAAAIGSAMWPSAAPWIVTVPNVLLLVLLGRLWWNRDLLVDPRRTPAADPTPDPAVDAAP